MKVKDFDNTETFVILDGKTHQRIETLPRAEAIAKYGEWRVSEHYTSGGYHPHLTTMVWVWEEEKKMRTYTSIRGASKLITKEMLADRSKQYDFCESDPVEAMTDPNEHHDSGGWFGIKRINGVFDNDDDEFIVTAGHYGGGNVEFGYCDMGNELQGYEKVVMNTIARALDRNPESLIYIEEAKE